MRFKIFPLLLLVVFNSGCGDQFSKPERPSPVVTNSVVYLNDLVSEQKGITAQANTENSTDSFVVERDEVSLQKNSVIDLNGSNIKVKVNRLYADDSIIQTFSENSAADQGVPGKSGGVIEIEAKEVIGKLTVIARGQNGGKGKEKGKSVHLIFDHMEHWCDIEGIDVPRLPQIQNPILGERGSPGGDAGTIKIHVSNGSVDFKSVAGSGGPRGDNGDIFYRQYDFRLPVQTTQRVFLSRVPITVFCPDPSLSQESGIMGESGKEAKIEIIRGDIP